MLWPILRYKAYICGEGLRKNIKMNFPYLVRLGISGITMSLLPVLGFDSNEQFYRRQYVHHDAWDHHKIKLLSNILTRHGPHREQKIGGDTHRDGKVTTYDP
jgi:hypothetical protein